MEESELYLSKNKDKIYAAFLKYSDSLFLPYKDELIRRTHDFDNFHYSCQVSSITKTYGNSKGTRTTYISISGYNQLFMHLIKFKGVNAGLLLRVENDDRRHIKVRTIQKLNNEYSYSGMDVSSFLAKKTKGIKKKKSFILMNFDLFSSDEKLISILDLINESNEREIT